MLESIVLTSRHHHTNADEMRFLDRLGTYMPQGCRVSYQQEMTERQYRKYLLQNYLTAASQRQDWGTIDSVVIINYARNLLGKA